MTDTVVVVGPKAVTGPGVVDPELVAAALECLDDELGLIDDRVLPAGDLWRDVLGAAANGTCARIVLICPSWWANSRVRRVSAAAREWSANVVTQRRFELAPTASTVLEVAPDLVVVHADAQRRAIARGDEPERVVEAVVACLVGLPDVIVDVPSGSTLFGAELARTLRHRGIEVTVNDDRTLVDAVRRPAPDVHAHAPSPRRRVTPRVAAVALAIVSAGVLTATAAGLDDGDAASGATWLVEGRVAVEIPAGWAVERITSGPGSARVQVVSPDSPSDAIHVTQSGVPTGQTLDEAADSLRAALGDQPDGVFVDFTWPGERASRPAITYREVRPDRIVEWAVLLDDGVRIAVGCQAAGEPCDRAIRSARAVARK